MNFQFRPYENAVFIPECDYKWNFFEYKCNSYIYICTSKTICLIVVLKNFFLAIRWYTLEHKNCIANVSIIPCTFCSSLELKLNFYKYYIFLKFLEFAIDKDSLTILLANIFNIHMRHLICVFVTRK